MADSKLINKVSFFSVANSSFLRDRQLLKRFIASIFRSEGKRLDHLRVIFCSDQYLLNINKRYLQHDDLTDIITFDLSLDSSSTEGEIYISVDRVSENAAQYFATKKQELLRVIFHGVLHLCGYGDKSTAQKKQMRSKEDSYLSKYATFVSLEKRST